MEFSPTFPENFDGTIRLMILGEFPKITLNGDENPFTGDEGQLLRETLEEQGFDIKNLYISNVFWCHTVNNDIRYFFTEINSDDDKAAQFSMYKSRYLKKEWENQIYRLQEEIEMLKPELILTLGEIPFWALTGQNDMFELRGHPKIIAGPVKYKYSIMFPTFSPEFILKNMQLKDEFMRDIARAKELLETPPWDWPNMFGREYDAAFRN